MSLSLPEYVRVSNSVSELNFALGEFIYDSAVDAISRTGRFTVATSGSSLPQNLMAALRHIADSGRDLQTEKWFIFYIDERIVPIDHADSNHKATFDSLTSLPFFQTPLSHFFPLDSSLPPDDCASDYEDKVCQVFPGSSIENLPSFDLMLLGMGPDGHTASLFPGHPLLSEKSKMVASIVDSPKPPPQRITFTYPVINNANKLAFVATGSSKAPALKSVFNESIPIDENLPAARVIDKHGKKAVWFVDAPAVAF